MSKKHGRKLDMQEVFDLDAKVIAKAREMAHLVHGSNIKTASSDTFGLVGNGRSVRIVKRSGI